MKDKIRKRFFLWKYLNVDNTQPLTIRKNVTKTHKIGLSKYRNREGFCYEL